MQQLIPSEPGEVRILRRAEAVLPADQSLPEVMLERMGVRRGPPALREADGRGVTPRGAGRPLSEDEWR